MSKIQPSGYAALWGLSNVWAMQREYLPMLVQRAERFLAGFAMEPEQPKIANGVAVLPLIGALTPRGDMGTLSTMRWEAHFREAVKNPGIKGIMLDVDSPGGTVYYTAEVSQRIYDARGSKPVVAYGNGTVGSAAYWIASAAEKFVLSPGAEAGSVGVWMAHQNMAKAMEQAGVEVTIISYGDNKLEGSELAPLTEETKNHLQSRVNEMGAKFEADVARNRGVGVAKVRSQFGSGRMFSAKEAFSRGMADGVASAEKVFKDLMGGAQVSYTRRSAAADAELCQEWLAESEKLYQAECDAQPEFYAGTKNGWLMFTTDPNKAANLDTDILRRRLKLKEEI